jgi:hypothetical protein
MIVQHLMSGMEETLLLNLENNSHKSLMQVSLFSKHVMKQKLQNFNHLHAETVTSAVNTELA